MAQQHIKWLLSELPALVRKGVLLPEAAEQVATYYRKTGSISRRSVLSTVFTILGALLVGGGIILIFAHNWHDIPRFFRLFLLLGVLVGSQALVVRALRSAPAGGGPVEGATVFSILAFMANVALISQMYHIPGEMTEYFLICALVSLPLIYATRSIAGAIIYFLLVVSWAGAEQFAGGVAIPLWGLLAGMLPLLRRQLQEAAGRNSTLVFLWAFLLTIVVAAGITLEKALPGLWMVLYSSLFALMYLHKAKHVPSEGGFWEMPLESCGIVGQSLLILLLTFKWPWQNIGWNYYRTAGYHPIAAAFDYVVIIGALAWALLLLFEALRRRQRRALLFGAAPLLVACAFATHESALIPVLFVMNAYALVLGVDTILEGIRVGRRLWLNGGTLFVVLLILMRFFDSDMGMLVRGVSFVLIGLLFVYSNRLFARRMLKETHGT